MKKIPPNAVVAVLRDGREYVRVLVPAGWMPGPNDPAGPHLTNEQLMMEGIAGWRFKDGG